MGASTYRRKIINASSGISVALWLKAFADKPFKHLECIFNTAVQARIQLLSNVCGRPLAWIRTWCVEGHLYASPSGSVCRGKWHNSSPE
jgi:hypothetical protein